MIFTDTTVGKCNSYSSSKEAFNNKETNIKNSVNNNKPKQKRKKRKKYLPTNTGATPRVTTPVINGNFFGFLHAENRRQEDG